MSLPARATETGSHSQVALEFHEGQMTVLEEAVANKYGSGVLEFMRVVYRQEAIPQSNGRMRTCLLQRKETSPQGDGFEKHVDSAEVHLFEMLCKLILYAPEQWYGIIVGRPLPEDFKNDWKNIGVAFDASSRLRRAGIEYFHKKSTLMCQLARNPPFDTPCVFYLDPTDATLKQLPISQLPGKTPGAIRVVSVSDTHLLHRHISLPPGDLLVHAGDVSFEESRSCDGASFDDFVQRHPGYTMSQLRHWFDNQHSGLADALRWLGEAPSYQHKVLVGGNHDYILEQLGERADELCWEDYRVQYLRTERKPIKLLFDSCTILSVWGSGVSVAAGLDSSRAVRSGNSSFQVDVTSGHQFLSDCGHVNEADIMVTHTPPVGILLGKEGKTFDAINQLIENVKPQLYVCGHAHNEQDLLKGRYARIGTTVGVNAACTSTWNSLHGLPIVVDVRPSARANCLSGCVSGILKRFRAP